MVKAKGNKKKDRRRLIIAILLIFFYLLFVLFNVQGEYDAGILYISLLTICFLIIINWDKIPKKRPERKLLGFQKGWVIDLIVGISLGIVFLVVMSVVPGFIIAAPQAPQASAFPQGLSAVGQFLTVVGAASMVEEIAFRTVLFAILWIVLGISFFWAAFHSSWVFAIYHINAYAGSIAFNPIIAVSGAFISAFIVAMFFVYINKIRGSVSASIGTHGAINAGVSTGNLFVFVT